LFNKVFAVRFVGLQLLLLTTVGPMHALVFVPFFTACSRDLLSVLIIITIINPCKPYLTASAPTGEAESRLITLSIFGVR
jgi:hypothetical protein